MRIYPFFHASLIHILLAGTLLLFSWAPRSMLAPHEELARLGPAVTAGIVLPSDTKTKIKNIDNKSILSIELPRGFMWAVHQQDVNAPYRLVKRNKGPEYVCSGCKRGCEPSYHAQAFGCTACEESEMYESCAGQLMGFPTIKSPILGYGVLNTKVGMRLIEAKVEINSLIPGPAFLLHIPEVQQAIKALNQRIHHKKDYVVTDLTRDRHVGVLANVFGTLGVYFLPRNDVYQDPNTLDYHYRPKEGKPLRVVRAGEDPLDYLCMCSDVAAEKRDYCTKEEALSVLRCVPVHGCQNCSMTFQ